MQRIDKMLSAVRRQKELDRKRRDRKEVKRRIANMTTEQLRELVYGDPSEDRINEIMGYA